MTSEDHHYHLVIYRAPYDYLTLESLSAAVGIHPQLVLRFVDYGLLEPVQRLGSELYFEVEAVPRLRTIQRLRLDFGVSLPGIAIILDLRDKVNKLQNEVAGLRMRMNN